ncbi:MAG: Eco29kI family restriction endonuclease [Gammaproteobacteria bacterium AqS3]|nr:Eco29kI family restriction endonuclease [Gammaproteobacteria bacterium AqS3]
MDIESYRFQDARWPEVIASATAFFEKTQMFELSDLEPFEGAGVYGLYYRGRYPTYQRLCQMESLREVPIYVGKAVPLGWRQGREESKKQASLHQRLREHAHSIDQGAHLSVADFIVRMIVLEGSISSLIGALESELIKKYRPLWNSCIDGFGNHDPGRGRYAQSRSEWDTIHPGRSWAAHLKVHRDSEEAILSRVRRHLHARR